MVVSDTATADPTVGAPLVVLDGVNKWFGELHVLKDIDLTVARGEVVLVEDRLGVTMTEIIKNDH